VTTRKHRAPEGDPLTATNLGRSSRRVALRDAGVVADRARGMTWPAIALKHKLSVRRCQEVVQAWREDGLGDDIIDPIAEVRSVLDLLAQAVEDYATDEQKTKHDGVRVGARHRKIEAAMARFDLLQSLGLIPKPKVIALEREMQQVFAAFGDVLREHGASEEMLEAMADLSERQLAHRPTLELRRIAA
jgi:hypothetical protein